MHINQMAETFQKILKKQQFMACSRVLILIVGLFIQLLEASKMQKTREKTQCGCIAGLELLCFVIIYVLAVCVRVVVSHCL